MTDPTQGLPPAGWYPDPAGAPQQRWWDGRQWTDTLQATQPVELPAVSQPVAFVQPTTFPFQPAETPFQPAEAPAATATPTTRRSDKPKTETADDTGKPPAGRLHALALLVIGLATSAGGLALFLYGLLGTADPATASQNELYGALIAGFGALAMLLWLAVGAIRER